MDTPNAQIPQNPIPQVPPQQPQQPSPAMQIQQLLVQQQQYQQQYNQIVAFLKQNPNQTPEKIQEYKSQLDQLNASYLQTQSQLKTLGYTPVQVNKPATVKEGAKTNFSFKKLAIGCGFLLVLLVLGFGGGLYYLTQNPNALNSVGITAATAKSLLTIFAGLFFGVILLVGLGLLLTNIYRLITAKNQSKIRLILGLIGSLLILGVAGGAMGRVFGQIWKIQTDLVADPDRIIFPYLVGKDGIETLYNPSRVPMIAPSEMSYKLQESALLTYAAKNLGEVLIQNVVLNCGNPQKQTLSYQNGAGSFTNRCLYDKKGDYPLSLDLYYTNRLTNERLSKNIPMGTLKFTSEIQIFTGSNTTTSSARQPTALSATGGEFILGKAPVKISVDTTSIFRDFGLEGYNVIRDMDGDNVNDRENMVRFDYIYKLPKKYYPTVKFPDLSNRVYAFPVRVEQPDVPICDIVLRNFEKSRYKIQTNFLDGSASNIASYSYVILDSTTKKTIDTVNQNSRELDYTFPEKGSYIVLLNFITIDGKRGSCESDTLQLAQETIDVKYALKQRLPSATNFTAIPTTAISASSIHLDTIPQTIQIDLTSVTPDTSSTQKNIFVDGNVVLNQGTRYEFLVNEERDYQVLIVVENPDLAIKTEIPLVFTVKRPGIIGVLKATPDVGYEPLTVILDASQSILNATGDEIIYFTRDFGDGEVKTNLTNGVVSHTYKYDYAKENGQYFPKVSLTTRRGLTAQATVEMPILVKKQLVQVDISSPSHPTQIGRAGDTVRFLAEFNGLPETMRRSFGDGSNLSQCKGRACTEVGHIYTTAGTYKVILTLEFEDMQSIDAIMEIRIN